MDQTASSGNGPCGSLPLADRDIFVPKRGRGDISEVRYVAGMPR
jgi:hypothetical protein